MVYPRARGGARALGQIRARGKGLSPRTRGSLQRVNLVERLEGSIPAHAGEPISDLLNPTVYRVYPRARGGASPSTSPMAAPPGLSPRTRGSLGCPRFM